MTSSSKDEDEPDSPEKGHAFSSLGSSLASTNSRLLLTVFACACCMVCGPAAIFTNNHVMHSIHFEYPLLITSLGLGVSAFAMHSSVLLGFVHVQPMQKSMYWQRMVPVGALSALTFVLGNASYMFLSVSMIQVLKSLTPAFTLLMSFFDSPQDVTTRLTFSVVLMTFGGGWAVFWSTPGSCSMTGLTLMILSDFCEAVRTVAQQSIFRTCSMSLLETLYWYSPVAFICTLAGAVMLEFPRLIENEAYLEFIRHPLAFTLVGVLGFCVNVIAFWVIQLTSALTLKVLVTISGIMVVIISSAWLGDTLQHDQRVGYTIALLGFTWYQYERFRTGGRTESPPSDKREHTSNCYMIFPISIRRMIFRSAYRNASVALEI